MCAKTVVRVTAIFADPAAVSCVARSGLLEQAKEPTVFLRGQQVAYSIAPAAVRFPCSHCGTFRTAQSVAHADQHQEIVELMPDGIAPAPCSHNDQRRLRHALFARLRKRVRRRRNVERAINAHLEIAARTAVLAAHLEAGAIKGIAQSCFAAHQ